MLDYTIKRVLLMFLTLFLGSMVLFFALRVLPPQNAVEIRLGEELRDDPEIVDVRMRQLGIYGPLHEQYARWLTGFVTGDWGKSLVTARPIFEELKNRIPVSLELSLIALAFTWIVSFPLGVAAAVFQDKFPDYFLRTAAYALDALPSFVIGILLLMILALSYNWAPPPTFTYLWDDPVSHLTFMALPAFLVAIGSSGDLIRFTRTFLLEVMRQDYIRTARGKGLAEKDVVFRHALRNIALPLVTIVGFQIPALLTSSAVIEILFALPGMGRYLVEASINLDYNVVMATTMFFGMLVLVTQLMVDLSYAWLDPRVSYGRGST